MDSSELFSHRPTPPAASAANTSDEVVPYPVFSDQPHAERATD